MPAGATIRVAVRSKSARRTGVRLFADGDVGPGAKPGDFCRDVGRRQMDRKRKWTAGGILAQVAGAQVHGGIHRSGCFNAGEWTFPDYPLRGVYARNEVYAGVRGWESFEPWLSRIEAMDDDVIWKAASEIPPEWYRSDWDALEKLARELIERRARVRELIVLFRNSPRRPFPAWADAA